MQRRLALAVGALAFVVAAAAVAPSARAEPAALVSPYWGGYAVTAPAGTPTSFTQVQGTWTEPAVTCTAGTKSAASIWVGLGGFVTGSTGLEQIGTNANCGANGRPSYFAWFELFPFVAYPIKARVHAGDTLSASVHARVDDVVLRLRNATRRWTVTKTHTWATPNPDLSSAEWIVEVPQSCHGIVCTSTRLSEFGSLTMTDIAAATTAGSTTLAAVPWSVSAISLVPGPPRTWRIDDDPDAGTIVPAASPEGAGSAPGATPGPLSADGSSFTLAWLRTP